MESIMSETSRRGSSDVWITAAYEALLENGVDAVKIQPLARTVGLSRTSFYWFFEDREELLAALVALWRQKNTGGILRQAEAYAETIVEAVLNVFDCWLNADLFDSPFEFAMRSWSLQSADILAEVQSADQLRIAALTQMFQRFGYSETASDVHARAIYLVQIGYISMQTHEDGPSRMERIKDYVTVFTGHTPQPRELERFFARHRYTGPVAADRQPTAATP